MTVWSPHKQGVTCGLQTSPSDNLDNLTPQETTNQESGTVGAEGISLPFPGSSVVAGCEGTSGSYENPSVTETIDLKQFLLNHLKRSQRQVKIR